MAINKNHEFEELNGVKCGIVERNVAADRLSFLKKILEYNGYTTVAVPSPPPKAIATTPKPESEADPAATNEANELPAKFTLGVTDYTFNAINAIFGRSLKTADGHIVTLTYWQQKEKESHDEIPYFGNKAG